MSVARQKTFSFSDASVDVALPSIGASAGSPSTDQSHIFLRSPAPALHLVKIRHILSEAYQDMYYNSREPHAEPLVHIWSFCCRVREWCGQCPKNAPSHFSLLYRLELLYTVIIILSPSHRYPALCDYNKALLFDRCMDYISLVHQVLENPSVLPFLTILDIHRVQQVGRRLVETLSENFDFLLSSTVPSPSSVPPGTPDPLILAQEDRINTRPRAVRSIAYMNELLQFCARRWDLQAPLDDFERESAPLVRMLADSSVAYIPHQDKLSPRLPLAGNVYPEIHRG